MKSLHPVARSFLAAAFVMGLASAPARAEGPVVVELFTSQGCSSCPPADLLLGELAERPDVIALALHVDYWDYLGWRDVFGMPANTRRQKAYADNLGERMIFTPQIVIDGAVSTVGSRRETVLDEIAMAAATPAAALVSVTAEDGWLSIGVETGQGGSIASPADVVMFIYEPPTPMNIGRGENAARRLTYHNAVRDWWVLGLWTGDATTWRAPIPQDAGGVAILVQDGHAGRVLGATKMALDPLAPRVSDLLERPRAQ
jgi:hypothetical protein